MPPPPKELVMQGSIRAGRHHSPPASLPTSCCQLCRCSCFTSHGSCYIDAVVLGRKAAVNFIDALVLCLSFIDAIVLGRSFIDAIVLGLRPVVSYMDTLGINRRAASCQLHNYIDALVFGPLVLATWLLLSVLKMLGVGCCLLLAVGCPPVTYAL